MYLPTQGIFVGRDEFIVERRELRQTILQRLHESRRVRISAPPGAGKSSIIALIMDDLTRSGVSCLYVECAGFKDSPLSAQDYVLDQLKMHYSFITDWNAVLQTCGCLFLDDAHTLYRDSSFLKNLMKSDLQMQLAVFTSYYAEAVDADSPDFPIKVRDMKSITTPGR